MADTATHQNASRIDIVADQYSPHSIKFHTRSERKAKSSGQLINFNGNTLVPENMASTFLSVEQNKIALNNLIAESM